MEEPRSPHTSLPNPSPLSSSSFSEPAALSPTLQRRHHHRPPADTAHAAVYYELVPSAAPLPSVDLSLSLLGALSSSTIGNQHLYWTGIAGSKTAKLFRMGVLLSLLSYLFDSSIGSTLALIAGLCIFPTCINELFLLRYNVFKLLLRTFDFWFLMGLNTLYCLFGCLILGDLRSLVAITTWFGIIVPIAFDTIILRRKERRVSILIASPAAVLFSCAFALRLVDRMRVVSLTLADGVAFSGVDFAVNVTATIGATLMKTAIRAWQAHMEPSTGEYFDESTIKCLLYRCTLSLREIEQKSGESEDGQGEEERGGGREGAAGTRRGGAGAREAGGGGAGGAREDAAEGGELQAASSPSSLTPSGTRIASIILNTSPPPAMKGQPPDQYQTQLKLCPPKVSLLSSDDTLLPAKYRQRLFPFLPPPPPASTSQRRKGRTTDDRWQALSVVLGRLSWLGLALVGLICPTITMVETKASQCAPYDQTLTALSLIGLLATLVFVVSFASILNRRLVLWLLRSFDFHFSSAQASLACLGICDIFCWDERTIALLCVWLWFHWILLLDCLTPVWKTRLGFTKSLAVPLQCLLTLGQLWMVYELYFAPRPDFRNRLIFEGKVLGGRGVSFKVELYTFTTSRLLTQAVLSCRVLMKLCYRQENELILLQGDVEYVNVYLALDGGQEEYSTLRHGTSDPTSIANRRQKKKKITVVAPASAIGAGEMAMKQRG